MIVDCHTQIWSSNDQLGRAAPSVPPAMPADEGHHVEATNPVDKVIVLAFRSRALDAEVPNESVADYVRRHATKMIGFAGIDPNERDWLEDLRIAQDDLGFKGVTLSPENQDFHPSDTRAMRLYEECLRRSMPIMFLHDHRSSSSRLEFAQPLLLDEVALEFPTLRMVIGGIGYPWVDQTLVLLAKHRHVYADIAGLVGQPWILYTALLSAFELGVMDKLLFGSDFPFRLPAACIEALYSVNQFGHGSNLPAIPREQLRGIVERNTLERLGIGVPVTTNNRSVNPIFADDE